MSFGFNTKKLIEPNVWTSIGLFIVFMLFAGVFGADPLTTFNLNPAVALIVRIGCFIGIAGTLWYLITRLGTINEKPIWKKFT